MQAVHELYEVIEGGAWRPGDERITRMVVIGRNLCRSTLITSLDECCLV